MLGFFKKNKDATFNTLTRKSAILPSFPVAFLVIIKQYRGKIGVIQCRFRDSTVLLK